MRSGRKGGGEYERERKEKGKLTKLKSGGIFEKKMEKKNEEE